MKNINFARAFLIAGLLSLLIGYILLWARMISTQEERQGADFIAHYSAARIAKQEGYPAIYDIPLQIEIQVETVGYEFPESQTSYFTHPPFIVPVVVLILGENYPYSLARWSLFLLALNALSVFVLLRTLPAEWFTKSELRFIALGSFLFFPSFSGFMNGQDAALVLLGASFWLLGFINGKDKLSGFGLALVAIRPQLAIILSAPFLLKRQKSAFGLAIGGGILFIFSLVLIQNRGFWDYLTILNVVASGMWDHAHAMDIPALSGILRRSIPTLDQSTYKILTWGGFIFGLALLCIKWFQIKEVEERHIGFLCLAALIFVPYAHYHELTLLLIPTFCLMRIWARMKLVSGQSLALVPVGISFLTMFGFFGSAWMKFPVVYLSMVFLGYFLLYPEKINRLTLPRKPRGGLA